MLLRGPESDFLSVMDDEYTKGGDPIYRHGAREPELKMPVFDVEVRDGVEKHFRMFLGEHSTVYHEILSGFSGVHLDMYIFHPSPERPFITLVTSGMSDRPMNVPEGEEDIARAELVMCLPAKWPLEDSDWPIHLMKFLARLPHEYDTFFGFTHTIPLKIADTQFTGIMIGPVWTLPDSFAQVKVNDTSVCFYGLYPLYEEEMQFKISKPEGASALLQCFKDQGINEVLNVGRPNVAKRKPFWKRWTK